MVNYEELIQKSNRTKRIMVFLAFSVIIFNFLFVGSLIYFNPTLSPLMQIVVASPLSVINSLSVWWLSLGGKWK